jgi:hypothetical protein
MNDLRTPSGAFFVVNGVILLAVALLASDVRAPLSTTNVNLYTGLAMLIFGGTLLWLARRRQS